MILAALVVVEAGGKSAVVGDALAQLLSASSATVVFFFGSTAYASVQVSSNTGEKRVAMRGGSRHSVDILRYSRQILKR